jgi:hypothetical protein
MSYACLFDRVVHGGGWILTALPLPLTLLCSLSFTAWQLWHTHSPSACNASQAHQVPLKALEQYDVTFAVPEAPRQEYNEPGT